MVVKAFQALLSLVVCIWLASILAEADPTPDNAALLKALRAAWPKVQVPAASTRASNQTYIVPAPWATSIDKMYVLSLLPLEQAPRPPTVYTPFDQVGEVAISMCMQGRKSG